MSFTDLDRTLGSALSGAQRSTPDDAGRVILSVLAAPRGTHTVKDIRSWLRSRGNSGVRSLASSAVAFRALVESSDRYLADYSPERVRNNAARRVAAGLSFGLPGPEAALLAAIALDQMESGKDGTLLTRAFDVKLNVPRDSVIRRARSLASRGLLTIASQRTGVPTRVRLRRAAPATGWTPELGGFADALAHGEATAATEIFTSVLSPVFGYWEGPDNARVPVDGWYIALLDTLNIRTQTIPASRASRVRKTLRDLGFTDDLARFADDLADFETTDVVARRDAREAERQVGATERAASALTARTVKRAGWAWMEDAAPFPRRDTTDDQIERWLPELKKALSTALEAQTDDNVRRALPRAACDALTRTLRRRQWDVARVEYVLDSVFPERALHRIHAHAGEMPEDGDLVAWAKTVAAVPPTADETRLLRAHAQAHGRTVSSSARLLPFHALRAIYRSAGRMPAGGPDTVEAEVAWMREVVAAGGVPAELEPLVREDMEALGWERVRIDAALRRIVKENVHV